MERRGIIDCVVEGDSQAFGRLVSRYRDMAFGYAMTLLDHEQMAEDAVQEALIAAYTHLDHLQEPQAFSAWLRGIVRHQCYRVQRRRQPATSWEQMDEISGEEDDPAREVEAQAVREQVQATIATLPPAQREVVRLAYEAGLSQPEIAARLGLTAGAVNMRLHAARTRLRRRLLTMTDTAIQQHNPGRIQEADGPLVTAQFAPKATPPLFSLLTGGDIDRLCVVQHLNAGRIRAVSARPAAIWTPGQEIADTGQPFTEALDRAAVQRAMESLRPSPAGAGPLESGIKTIEVFAPLTQGGSAGIFAEWGLGVLVLLPELLRNLDRDENRQTL
ncbi:MAG TPA: sigma-70 family RNA polymerase sigma factor, partial [Chthonomonadaceae bacterium]|nr:sigma-70 family RNA polymerase sigma factor [Chthonomonadaceae bacterium]